MLFKPFFLQRKKIAVLNCLSNQTFHPEITKISYIQPEMLKLIHCKSHAETIPINGIPFDIEALALSLKRSRPEESILPFILEHAKEAKEESLIIICGGSETDGHIPYMEIPLNGDHPQFGQVESEYEFPTDNVYQLMYGATG